MVCQLRGITIIFVAEEPLPASIEKEDSLRTMDLIMHNLTMKTLKYIYWQEDSMWLGYLEEFPDYITQGESREELQEQLKDLHAELTSGAIPGVRRSAEIHIA